jgi:hypothetical protein
MPSFINSRFVGYDVEKPQAIANCLRNQNSIGDGSIHARHVCRRRAQPGSKATAILVGGQARINEFVGVIFRLNPNRPLDTTFGSCGTVTVR